MAIPSPNLHTKPKKKALLVGIRYEGRESIDCPHRDALAFKQVLIDTYNYPATNITVMLDHANLNNMEPTRQNLLREVKALVRDAHPGDQFVFYYAGHGDQKQTKSLTEEDGLDEGVKTADSIVHKFTGNFDLVLVPSDNDHLTNTILDNELRQYLVDPLPVGSSLVAIIDACHSGTMLDLKHYRCNRIYTPWVNKGIRRTASRHNRNVRRHDMLMPRRNSVFVDENAPNPKNTHKLSINIPRQAQKISTQYFSMDSEPDQPPVESIDIPSQAKKISTQYFSMNSEPDQSPMDESFPIPSCSSPTSDFCTGVCKPITDQKAHVVCISACKDIQLAWDYKEFTMTKILIDALKKNPHPHLNDLMTYISHCIYDYILEMHRLGRQRKLLRRQRLANGVSRSKISTHFYEVDNFQDPQLGSHTPLELNESFDL